MIIFPVGYLAEGIYKLLSLLSVGYLAEGMQQGRREEGSKQQWMMSAGQLAIMMRIIMVSACQFVRIPFSYPPFSQTEPTKQSPTEAILPSQPRDLSHQARRTPV